MTETKATYAAGGAVVLKPCPFCGAPAELSDIDDIEQGVSYIHYVAGCSQCDAAIGLFKDYDTPEAVAADWNRRADRRG